MDSIYCPDPKADGESSKQQQQQKTTKLDTDTPSAQILLSSLLQLDASAQALLDYLDLPLVHPLCSPGNNSKEGADLNNDGELSSSSSPSVSFDGDGSDLNFEHVFELPKNSTLKTTSSRNNNNKKKDINHNDVLNALVPPPTIGSISLLELHDNSMSQLLLTATTMSAPTMAMAELLLRFFAVFLSPLCLAYLLHKNMSFGRSSARTATNEYIDTTNNTTMYISFAALASSAVLFTDSLYVYEYGRWFGFSLFVLSTVLSVRCATFMIHDDDDEIGRSGTAKKKSNSKTKKNIVTRKSLFQLIISIFVVVTTIIFLRSDGGHAMETAWKKLFSFYKYSSANINDPTTMKSYNPLDHVPHPGIDLPTIEEGTYHSQSNDYITSIISHWPESSRSYTVQNGATPYLVNGDQRTTIPLIVNKIEEQEYVRVWTQNQFDGEWLALDVAFPTKPKTTNNNNNDEDDEEEYVYYHDLEKPVYLVLHGLNGGSHAEYVKDLVERRRAEGSTVIVLIARGMMDTKMVGWNVFHGARTGDVDIAARSVRRGLESLANANPERKQRQVLTGVGYSVGAMILSNYVARSGEHCALDAAMAISGGLDMRQQLNFKRSIRLWQPMITFGLREDTVVKYARHYKSRLTKEQFLNSLRITSVSALDVQAIVTYNSFDSILHYYSEVSAMGDRTPEFDLFGSGGKVESSNKTTTDDDWGRIADVSIPFAVVKSLDDPLVGWRTIGTNNPQRLADSGNGNVMLVLTKAGGHVGWPLGNRPSNDKWKWMNDAARDFANAVDMAKRD